MREIIFRGKRLDNGEWVEGYFCHCIRELNGGKTYLAIQQTDDNSLFFREVDPDTIGQYTGLTDKNGRKIFEGDIVRGRFLFEREILSVVTFKDGAFGLEWNRGKAKEFSAFTSMCNIEYEVIGNIYDNPDCGAKMEGGGESDL